ncbi:hypothetical protein G3O08_05470 [Cryomorpha ignava]|uniref:Toxin-antitoxin system YwqK family antitoxin n=1 Tax=Cryomorpha ignava TaxID=101383 RepID=A0A7K3WMS2_9FLAO|nr:hypothetical protein [Cryomorpha ignava]NEN22947.1 hypothetical protein [Cryomorpha ignava]
MKKLILIAITIISAAVVNAQTNSSLQSIDEMDLISMNDGESKYYSNNGDFSVDEAGRVSGQVLTFHENGNLEEQGALLLGKKQGGWTKYSADGIKMNEAHYSNGQKDGDWKVWDANGILRMELSYYDGKRVGTWKFYDESGKLQSSKDYN